MQLIKIFTLMAAMIATTTLAMPRPGGSDSSCGSDYGSGSDSGSSTSTSSSDSSSSTSSGGDTSTSGGSGGSGAGSAGGPGGPDNSTAICSTNEEPYCCNLDAAVITCSPILSGASDCSAQTVCCEGLINVCVPGVILKLK